MFAIRLHRSWCQLGLWQSWQSKQGQRGPTGDIWLWLCWVTCSRVACFGLWCACWVCFSQIRWSKCEGEWEILLWTKFGPGSWPCSSSWENLSVELFNSMGWQHPCSSEDGPRSKNLSICYGMCMSHVSSQSYDHMISYDNFCLLLEALSCLKVPSWYVSCPCHTTHRSCTKSMSESMGGRDLVIRKLLYWVASGTSADHDGRNKPLKTDPSQTVRLLRSWNWHHVCWCPGFHLQKSPAESNEDLRRRHLNMESWQFECNSTIFALYSTVVSHYVVYGDVKCQTTRNWGHSTRWGFFGKPRWPCGFNCVSLQSKGSCLAWLLGLKQPG